ncbi:hypothetical protein QBC42DRAFT_277567 [Cladorrhinum samala]|uniref:Secreted protein n=1 Tax=Cladorrhinum samala TaxID=585594 RepID=A0AAV9HDA7_9PEZI|nr:hypothetical protein QBC42DRAFT_277567 [Cladorrhinum samala]
MTKKIFFLKIFFVCAHKTFLSITTLLFLLFGRNQSLYVHIGKIRDTTINMGRGQFIRFTFPFLFWNICSPIFLIP